MISQTAGILDPATRVARGVKLGGARFRTTLRSVGAQGKLTLLRLANKPRMFRNIWRAYESEQIDTGELIDVARRYNNLDVDQKEQFAYILGRGGDDAVKGAAKLSDEGFDAVMRADIPNSAQAKNFRHFAGLTDETRQATFQRILRDEDLADSWLRSVGAEETDLPGTRRALQRVEEIEDSHAVREFESSREANERFIREKRDQLDNPQGPHREGGIVIEFETGETQVVYRLWDSTEGRMMGEFTTIEDVVINADSFAELTSRLAAPSEFNYDRIARVEVPEGTSMRYSTVGRNYGRTGGAAQMRLIDRVPENYWTPLDSLSEVGIV